MRYRYLDDFRRGISVFAIFLTVLRYWVPPNVPLFLAKTFEKVSFDPYNFRITKLSARKSELMKNF